MNPTILTHDELGPRYTLIAIDTKEQHSSFSSALALSPCTPWSCFAVSSVNTRVCSGHNGMELLLPLFMARASVVRAKTKSKTNAWLSSQEGSITMATDSLAL